MELWTLKRVVGFIGKQEHDTPDIMGNLGVLIKMCNIGPLFEKRYKIDKMLPYTMQKISKPWLTVEYFVNQIKRKTAKNEVSTENKEKLSVKSAVFRHFNNFFRSKKKRPKFQEIVDIHILEGRGDIIGKKYYDRKRTFKGVKKYIKKGPSYVINPTYDRLVNNPLPFYKVKVKINYKEKLVYESKEESQPPGRI